MSIQLFILAVFIADAGVIRDGRSVVLELPKVQHSIPMPRAEREDAFMAAITYDGHVYFNKQRIYASELSGKLREMLERSTDKPEKKIYIKADARARYRSVKEVLDQVRLAGIEKVSFLTDISQR